MEQNKFKPFISADQILPEMTLFSIILGAILAIVFGAANAYLGLRVGLTVSASIPAAVISMGVIRFIFKRDSILENNMVQTIGSAGESLAAGAIFTMPALFMWMEEWGQGTPSLVQIGILSLIGGILGVIFMIPLRKAIIVKEHDVLPYPEGTACAEVLLAGEEGGTKAKHVFKGLGIASIYKLIADGFKLFPSSMSTEIDVSGYRGGIGIDALPALIGVGYITGPRIASYMLGGGVIGWLVLMPAIYLFGGDSMVAASDVAISSMSIDEIWGSYIRYIGAGAVATGGVLSLIKSLPLIVKTFKEAMGDLKNKDYSQTTLRTDQDMSMKIIGLFLLGCILLMLFLPALPLGITETLLVVIFGFFFATVSSRLVGLIGSSNNPVSGMTIATLLVTSFILKSIGNAGQGGMMASISIGTIICIVAAIAGDASQDLKTGFIVGATPVKQQFGEIIGVLVSAVVIGGILWLLNASYGYGGEALPAPQATLMKLIVEGVMEGNLPWSLVFIGVGIAFVVEILGIPVLPFAVGLYLPINTSVGIMVGGLVRLFIDKKKSATEELRNQQVQNGVLFTSGFIAGEGLVGILIAVTALVTVGGKTLMEAMDVSGSFSLGTIGSIVAFIILIITLIRTCLNKNE